MAIQPVTAKDSTGATITLATSDILGGGVLANAFVPVIGTGEVTDSNPMPGKIISVPADPFGANADAASATGSISAKLRQIAANGIPITSLPSVVLASGTAVAGKFGIQVGGSDVGTTNRMPVRGSVVNPTASLTLPSGTPTYAIGDLVANSANGASVTPIAIDLGVSEFLITGVRVKSSRTTTSSAAQFTLMLYEGTPTITSGAAAGDDATYQSAVSIGSAIFLGSLDFTLEHLHVDGFTGTGIPPIRPHIPVKLSSGTTINAFVRARNTYQRVSGEVLTFYFDGIPA